MELEHLFPKVVDASMRADHSYCPKKFYWRHILGLSPNLVSIHLKAGAAYAKGLEVFRVSYYGDKLPFSDARAEGVLAILKEYGDPDFEPTEAKQWHNVVDAYLSYLENWNPEFDYLHPLMIKIGDSEKPAVEFSFLLPIHNYTHPDSDDPLLYSGRFDLLGLFQDQLFVVDDKTTSRLGATWSQQWALRSQFTGYCWGAREFGHNVAGAIIRGTAILKTKITHAESVVYRPAFVVERWETRLNQHCYDIVKSYQDLKRGKDVNVCFPAFGEENGACSAYGGCAYQKLCESPSPETWMEGNYVVDRWDPTFTQDD